MNRQEASLYFRLRVVPCSPVPPNKAMQTDGRFATAADRQGVRCQPTTPMETLPTDLQDRITKHLRDWSVQAEHLVKTDTSVLVFGHRGSQPVVLKVLCTPGDEWRSGEVLASFEGRAVVRVYAYADGALLLEQLRPGTQLAQPALAGQDDRAIDTLADMIGSMEPRQSPSFVPTVMDWAAGFDRYAATEDRRIPDDLLAQAQGIYWDLANSQSQIRLLHGDLQHYNVLLDAQRGWLAIDAKGVLGEPAFEIGAVLRNPIERPDLFAQASVVERRVRHFAAKLMLDEDRVLLWGFAQAVLSAIWTVEDGHSPDSADPGLLLAQTIRSMLSPLN